MSREFGVRDVLSLLLLVSLVLVCVKADQIERVIGRIWERQVVPALETGLLFVASCVGIGLGGWLIFLGLQAAGRWGSRQLRLRAEAQAEQQRRYDEALACAEQAERRAENLDRHCQALKERVQALEGALQKATDLAEAKGTTGTASIMDGN
jgi:hypothetical protein